MNNPFYSAEDVPRIIGLEVALAVVLLQLGCGSKIGGTGETAAKTVISPEFDLYKLDQIGIYPTWKHWHWNRMIWPVAQLMIQHKWSVTDQKWGGQGKSQVKISQKAWVCQEVGYAVYHGIPVIPQHGHVEPVVSRTWSTTPVDLRAPYFLTNQDCFCRLESWQLRAEDCPYNFFRHRATVDRFSLHAAWREIERMEDRSQLHGHLRWFDVCGAYFMLGQWQDMSSWHILTVLTSFI